MSSAADSSVKVVASPQISYALILALIGAYGGGAWFLATQTAAQAAMNQRITDETASTNLRISRIADDVIARLKVLETRDEARGTSLVDQGNRLTRIESKIDFLTQTVAPRK